ncbi:iron ABC transporter substrate-binding protein [Kaistia algarum]|uniref:ABC transporter substrate-binding protein n=1 Tax=Kaistia algarum TaxID=2083279 RepID=UPI000CE75FD9|nr:extracellular solute-binding protein [Kaistia algarum]MCX5512813.1 extracellular solute-binding protein [Kaistia algarum]PPE81692.1 iron ABC transporter substrate-binding protein [Kaistia algarum]
MASFSISRRALLGGGSLALGAALLNPRMSGPAFASPAPLADLVAAAQREKVLNTIALSPNWVFGKLMTDFAAQYGVEVNPTNPEGSSAEELQAIRSLKGQDRAPDSLDLAPSFARQAVSEGLLAPYKVATFGEIPDSVKDADGRFTGCYYGIISFAVNKAVVGTVPQSWADLLKADYRGMVAMGGNPMRDGSAFAAVMAASLANGGSFDDITPGVEFFARLAAAGNYNPAQTDKGTMVSGQTPIALRWDYLNLTIRDEEAGRTPFEVIVPKDGAPFGNYYVQGISAFAPHPNLARLWQEFLFSDEGQLGFLAGYAHPMRFGSMLDQGVVPKAILDRLPSPEAYKQVRFASQAQLDKAKQVVADLWPKEVRI